jgi:hypothetical protein
MTCESYSVHRGLYDLGFRAQDAWLSSAALPWLALCLNRLCLAPQGVRGVRGTRAKLSLAIVAYPNHLGYL